MSITAEQLQRFCASHDIREWTLKPNTVGGFTYATNGHMAIRVPAQECLVFERHRNMTESMAQKLDERLSLDGVEFGPLNLPPEPEWVKCSQCEGTGQCERCFECNGEGERECDMGHTHVCDGCGGDGQIRGTADACMGCEGSGRDYRGTPVAERSVLLGGTPFDWRDLSMIAGLPLVEVGLEKSASPLSESRCLLFRFDGGRGVLLPLNPNVEVRR